VELTTVSIEGVITRSDAIGRYKDQGQVCEEVQQGNRNIRSILGGFLLKLPKER
jgi:hypothetical protein